MGALAQRRSERPVRSIDRCRAERRGSIEDRNRWRIDVVGNRAGQCELAVIARHDLAGNRQARRQSRGL